MTKARITIVEGPRSSYCTVEVELLTDPYRDDPLEADIAEVDKKDVVLGVDEAITLLEVWVNLDPLKRAYAFGEGERDGGAIVVAWLSVDPTSKVERVLMFTWDAWSDGTENLWDVAGFPFGVDVQLLPELKS